MCVWGGAGKDGEQITMQREVALELTFGHADGAEVSAKSRGNAV